MQPVTYILSARAPHTHRYRVRIEVEDAPQPARVVMPAWSPGSYMLREYARRIEWITASTADGAPLDARKVRKETWEVEHDGASPLVIEYEIAAYERTPRMPYLDTFCGLFTGSNTLAYIEGATDREAEVRVELPEGWRGYCSRIEGFIGDRYTTPNFDVLADTPFSMGPDLELVHFEVRGTPHAMVMVGESPCDAARFVPDMTRVLEVTAGYFGDDLPYERYLFHTLLSGSVRGGLEHLDSCVLIYPRHWLVTKEKYVDFMRLVAHEFFHVWNIKRIRPDTLGPFDYRTENHSRDLWVAEGWTSYVQFQLLYWSGIIDKDRLLTELGRRIALHESKPGRHIQDLESSSFDAWIKFYKRDGDSNNAMISYYLKGSLAAMLLDLQIIANGQSERGLGAVLRHLWERYAREGWPYPEGAMPGIIDEATGGDYGDWYEHVIRSTRELPWDATLERVGLRLHRTEDTTPSLGIQFAKDSTRARCVLRDGAAWEAGLMLHDEIVAVDGYRATARTLETLVQRKACGDTVTVTFFRDGLLRSAEITLAPSPKVKPSQVRLVPIEDPSAEQLAAYEAWLDGP